MKYPLYDGYGFERYARPVGWGPLARRTYEFKSAPLRVLRLDWAGHWFRWELWSKEEDRWVPLEGPDEPKPTGEHQEVKDDPALRRVLHLERYTGMNS